MSFPFPAFFLAPRRALALASAAALSFVAPPALALDPFEIQVYDGTANPPGVFGLEVHVNYVVSGLQTSTTTELPPNHQFHVTYEPSYGVTRWWEIGGYFQTALRPDGELDYAGVKLRTKFVTPPKLLPNLRLGLNLELSLLPDTYDAGRWANEIRPIAAWETDDFMFVVNPVVDTSLAGPDFKKGPEFDPLASAMWKIRGTVGLGLEFYGSVRPLVGPLPLSQLQEYLFEVVNLLSVPRFELNAGVGEGLTSGSNGFVAKMILGYEFGDDPEEHAAAMRPMAFGMLRGR
jgi:hypothetical protein